MMLASLVFANAPKKVNASSSCCDLGKKSVNEAKILPASEISLSSISILAVVVKAFTIGNNDLVANAGASSVFV